MSICDLILAHAPRQAMHARLAEVSLPNVECFCFSYVKGAGHMFRTRRGRQATVDYEMEQVAGAAFEVGIDAKLCWNSPRSARDRYNRRDETEGRAFLTRRSGWTSVAFWDRSGDSRGGCNTAFIVHDNLTFSQVIRAAKHAWPEVWARFTFPVVEVDERGQEVA